MDPNIHHEQTHLAHTASASLPVLWPISTGRSHTASMGGLLRRASSSNAPSASVAQQVSKSASSSFGDYLALPDQVPSGQELTVLKPLHNRAHESVVSSRHDTVPESASESVFASLTGARYATTPVTKGNHLLEGKACIRSSHDLDKVASHQEKITTAKSVTGGAHTFESRTIQENLRSVSQPSSIQFARRKTSSHRTRSESPASLRAANTSKDHSLQENASPRSQPLSTYSTALCPQEASAPTASLRGLSLLENRNTRDHIPLRFGSKALSHRENAFVRRANPIEAHSLRKPVLRPQPPSADPVSSGALSVAITHS